MFVYYRKLYYSLHFIAIGALLLPEKRKHSSVQSHELPQMAINSESVLLKEVNGETSNKLKLT